jgi:hypothetical protein
MIVFSTQNVGKPRESVKMGKIKMLLKLVMWVIKLMEKWILTRIRRNFQDPKDINRDTAGK